LLQAIEREVALQHAPLPAPKLLPLVKHSRNLASLLSPAILPRMIVGAVTLIVINSLLYGFRNLAADILCTAGTEHREIISLFARHGTRRTDRIGDRRFYLRLLGAQADDRRGFPAHYPDRELLSIY